MIAEATEHTPTLLRMIISLIIVIALMGGFALILRKVRTMNLGSLSLSQSPEKRLQVIERLSLDPRRQLIIASCDEQEHLILLGAERETILDHKPIKTKTKTKIKT